MKELINPALNRIEEYYNYKENISVPSPPPATFLVAVRPSNKCQNNNELKYARLTKLINAALNRIKEYYNYKEKKINSTPPEESY